MPTVVTANYSKKLPLKDVRFGSQMFSASLQAEVTEGTPEAIQRRIASIFAEVRACVERQIAGGENSDGGRLPGAAPLSSGPPKCTEKQRRFALQLAAEQHLSPEQLDEELVQIYGVSLRDMDTKSCSRLISDLRRSQRKAA